MAREQQSWRHEPAPPWQRPAIGKHPIPGHRYTSREFFEREFEHMWTKVWLLLGRESELPNPGDWQMEEVGPESILMVRQADGRIRAFYNVCQHRGNRLVASAQGHVRRFVCKYHGWAFLPDGVLDFAQDAEDFPDGNPCGKVRLKEIPCETFAGFVWVNMDPHAGSLRDYLGPIWDDWSMYPVADMQRYLAYTVRVPCNWKVIQDNFNESYHLRAVHPQASVTIEEGYRDTQFDMCAEGHSRMIMHAGYPARSLSGRKLREPLMALMQEWDLDPEAFVGREREIRPALQQQKRKLGPARGYTHYDNLRDEQLTDFYHYTVFPNFAVSVTADGFHFLRTRPHPTDPEQCIFDNWFYATEPAGDTAPVMTPAGPVARGARVEHVVLDYGDRSVGVGMDQDLSIVTGQQLGFRSRGFEGVYLSGQEARVRRYHEVIDEYLDGTRPHGRLNARTVPIRSAT
ncbi:MAG: aromatic ring-hydroxylating dioxygenase subunit alpha [Pseudomonadales bacterium]|nr:aromatic ring-hydroxylating dioxygenase subunit alpha [Pseudomonadales bacterium]